MSAGSGTNGATMEAPERTAWRRARAELDAAQVVLADPHLDPRSAIALLQASLTGLLGNADRPAAGLTDEIVRVGEGLRETLASEAGREHTSRETLLRIARDLHAVLCAEEPRRFGDELRRERSRARWRRIRIGAAVLTPVLAYLVFTPFSYREGQWRGAYYPEEDFTGDVYRRRDSDISFKWKESSPNRALPDDHFSVRWDTCVLIEDEIEATFALTSDDGSRLFIGGETVVDNWGAHGPRTRGGKVVLGPGLHHLRVEYFEYDSGAQIDLNASLDGTAPTALPARVLVYPDDDLTLEDPCEPVRARRGLDVGAVTIPDPPAKQKKGRGGKKKRRGP